MQATGQSRRRSAPVPGGSDVSRPPMPVGFNALRFPERLRPGTGALRSAMTDPLLMQEAARQRRPTT